MRAGRRCRAGQLQRFQRARGRTRPIGTVPVDAVRVLEGKREQRARQRSHTGDPEQADQTHDEELWVGRARRDRAERGCQQPSPERGLAPKTTTTDNARDDGSAHQASVHLQTQASIADYEFGREFRAAV